MLKELFKGIILVFLIWIINIIIAFGIFSPTQQDTLIILISWFVIDVFLILFLFNRKLINKNVLIFSVMMMVVLGIFYLIPVNSNIPDSAKELNEEISSENSDRIKYAEELFFEIETKWNSPIREYLRQPQKVFFIKDFETLWNVEGYLPSNLQAQMYERLLIESGRFEINEIEFKNAFCSNSPHGFVIIEDRIFADLWAVDTFPREGIEEVYEFGQRAEFPCDKLIGEPVR